MVRKLRKDCVKIQYIKIDTTHPTDDGGWVGFCWAEAA